MLDFPGFMYRYVLHPEDYNNDPADVPLLIIDNDQVVAYDGDTKVLDLHPEELLRQALDELQIAWERV